MSDPILVTNDLRKNYGGVRALDGVDLVVPAGDIVGLVGPNGSGKTTLIQTITGSVTPDEGTVALDGEDITSLSSFRCARSGVRRTFQDLRVFAGMSVLDHLLIAYHAFDGAAWYDDLFRTHKMREADAVAHERAAECIALVGLEGRIDDPVDELSYGQQKLVNVAASMMSSPKVLCLDEPMAGVNPSLVYTLSDAIRSLKDTGVSLVIVEHNMEFITKVADSVTVLAGGKSIAAGRPSILREEKHILDVFLGETVS